MAQSPCSMETTTYITTGGAKRGDRGVRLENTRLCERSALRGAHKAVGLAGGSEPREASCWKGALLGLMTTWEFNSPWSFGATPTDATTNETAHEALFCWVDVDV